MAAPDAVEKTKSALTLLIHITTGLCRIGELVVRQKAQLLVNQPTSSLQLLTVADWSHYTQPNEGSTFYALRHLTGIAVRAHMESGHYCRAGRCHHGSIGGGN